MAVRLPGVVERDRVIKDRVSDTRYFEYCELSAFDGASYQLVIEYFYDWETHEYGNGSVTVKKSGSAVGTGYEGFCDYPNTNGTNQEGITYSYRVVDSQKNTMYFNKNGLIQAVKDKYGNMIRYFYNGGKVSQVVDSMGREINFTWNQNAVTVTVSGTDVSITYGQSVENNPDDPTNYFSVDDEYITTMTKRDKAGTSPVTSTTTYRAKKHYKPYRLDSRGQINEYVLTDVEI